MDVFSERSMDRLAKEKEKTDLFYVQKQTLQIVSAVDPTTSFSRLMEIKDLFQRMLPKMPRDYIMRQVYDNKHISLCLCDKESHIIGAVCYRPAFEIRLIEVVFFAVDSYHHIGGYGAFLFNCLKEVCKLQYSQYLKDGGTFQFKNREIDDLRVLHSENAFYSENGQKGLEDGIETSSLYMLTYADNSAIGFFKKQGFSLQPRSTAWIGYIKDYDGGTLMEAKVHQQINYLKKWELVEGVRHKIFDRMQSVNEYHVVHGPEMREKLRLQHKNILQEQNQERSGFLHNFISFLVSDLKSNSSAWPFLEPVDTTLVPDYLTVVSRPMDFQKIVERHTAGGYLSLQDFSDDFDLMISNCLAYNLKETQYYKCGEALLEAYKSLVLRHRDAISHWGFSVDFLR